MMRFRHNNEGAAISLVLVAGTASGVGAVVSSGSFPTTLADLSWEGAFKACALAVEAAVTEELLFRGVLLWVLVSLGLQAKRSRPISFAVAASALVFGLLHLLPSAAASPVGFTAVEGIQALLKVVEGVLFGALMGILAVQSRWFPRFFSRPTSWSDTPSIVLSLSVPVAVHVAFDILCFAPAMAAGSPFPTTYLTGALPDTVTLAVVDVLLAAALAGSLRPVATREL